MINKDAGNNLQLNFNKRPHLKAVPTSASSHVTNTPFIDEAKALASALFLIPPKILLASESEWLKIHGQEGLASLEVLSSTIRVREKPFKESNPYKNWNAMFHELRHYAVRSLGLNPLKEADIMKLMKPLFAPLEYAVLQKDIVAIKSGYPEISWEEEIDAYMIARICASFYTQPLRQDSKTSFVENFILYSVQ